MNEQEIKIVTLYASPELLNRARQVKFGECLLFECFPHGALITAIAVPFEVLEVETAEGVIGLENYQRAQLKKQK